MNIISSINNISFIFEEKIIPSLSIQQQKIALLAAVAFALIACILIGRCSIRAKPETPKDPPSPKGPLSYEQVIHKAEIYFAKDPQKGAIIDRIKKRLSEEHYEDSLSKNKKPVINLNCWTDLLHGDFHTMTPQEKEVIANATDFLKKLPGISVYILE